MNKKYDGERIDWSASQAKRMTDGLPMIEWCTQDLDLIPIKDITDLHLGKLITKMNREYRTTNSTRMQLNRWYLTHFKKEYQRRNKEKFIKNCA